MIKKRFGIEKNKVKLIYNGENRSENFELNP